MIKNNQWGLPKTIEVEGKKSKELKAMVDSFYDKNYLIACKQSWIKSSDYYKKYYYNEELGYYFISRNLHQWAWPTHSSPTRVKRELRLTFNKIEVNNTTKIINKISFEGNPVKGINNKQFKKEFISKETQFLVLPSIKPWWISHNLEECGFFKFDKNVAIRAQKQEY